MRIYIALMTVALLSACAAKAPKTETDKAAATAATTPAPLPSPTPVAISSEPTHKKSSSKTDDDYMDPISAKAATDSAQTPAASSKEKEKPAAAVSNSVSAEKSLNWLQNGNRRFVKAYLRNDGASAKDRVRLASAQSPHAVILSCSDSRVPPEIVFDQKLGEVFVVRTIGEALDDAALASVEYGVKQLGARLVLVMGHESCGAVKATLSHLDNSDAGSPALNNVRDLLKPHLQGFANKKASDGYLKEAWANTSGVAKDLLERSEILRDAVNTGGVKIQTAVYHLTSGEVEFR